MKPYHLTSDAASDGEIVWSWPPDAEVKRVDEFTCDGGYQARYPEEITYKP